MYLRLFFFVRRAGLEAIDNVKELYILWENPQARGNVFEKTEACAEI